MAMLDAKCCMLNILGDTLSEVEIDTLVDTLVEEQARLEVKSLENRLIKREEEAFLDRLPARISEV